MVSENVEGHFVPGIDLGYFLVYHDVVEPQATERGKYLEVH